MIVLQILDGLCEDILEARANAVFYITDADLVQYQTAAVSYFLQIADFIGLPVIMWTADMTGLPSVSVALVHVCKWSSAEFQTSNARTRSTIPVSTGSDVEQLC